MRGVCAPPVRGVCADTVFGGWALGWGKSVVLVRRACGYQGWRDRGMGGFNEVEVVCCDMGEGHPRNLRIGGGGARREMQGFPKLHFEKICFSR